MSQKSNEDTGSSQSIKRQLRSDQDGPMTASFKYEDKEYNDEKVTFLTQVDNRDKKQVTKFRAKGKT